MAFVTPILTSRQIIAVAYQNPVENLQAVPTALPAAEPGVNQIDYLVAAGDLPTSSLTIDAGVYVALMYAGGRDTGGNSTINWRMLKNAVSVATGSTNIFLNDYWTLNARFYNVVVGDTLSIRLWRGANAVNWDYDARQIQFSRVSYYEKYPLLYAFNIATVATHPTLVLGNPGVSLTSGFYIYGPFSMSTIRSAATVIDPWKAYDATYKLWRIYEGDVASANNGYILLNAAFRPFYRRNYVPTQVILRGLQTGGQP